MWTDELYAANAAIQATAADVIHQIRTDVHPPGYFLALWGWAKIFGDGEAALRSFSAVAGILLIPLTFRIGRQFFDVKTGLASAFIASILIQGIYFSQEARSYSWLALLSAASVTVGIDYLRSRKSWQLALLLGLTIANCYLHYFGTLFSGLFWLGMIWESKRRGLIVWPSVTAGAICMATFVPWISVAMGSVGKANWIPKPNGKFIAETLNVFYGPGMPLDLLCLASLVVGLGFGLANRRENSMAQEKWLLLWIAVPLVASLVISFALRPVYSPRNMYLGYVAASLLLGRALMYLPKIGGRTWPTLVVFAVGLYGLHIATGKGYLFRPTKQQVREASQYVIDQNTDRLPIVVVGWDYMNFGYYWRNWSDRELVRIVTPERLKQDGLAKSVSSNRFWIASAGIDINLSEDLSRDFVIEKRGEFNEARAYLLQRKNLVLSSDR